MSATETHNPEGVSGTRPPAAARDRGFNARCKICNSPFMARIERKLAMGGTGHAVAAAFGFSVSGVWRHWSKHTPQSTKDMMRISVLKPGATLETLVAEEGVDHLETLKLARASILWSLDQSVQLERHRDVALLTSQLVKVQELIGTFTGDFKRTVEHVSILLTPEYLQLRNTIIVALTPYAEARNAVVAALRRLESSAPAITATAAPND